MMAKRSHPRAGFTLLELVVALAIGGLVVLTAHLVYSQLASSADHLTEAARTADREANADRMLHALVRGIEPNLSSRSTFVGHETAARFETWCDVPAGWQERCTVTLAVIAGENDNLIVADFSSGDLRVLRRTSETAELRYLHDAADGGTWLRSWTGSISVPLAVGLVLDGDTLILRVGERG